MSLFSPDAPYLPRRSTAYTVSDATVLLMRSVFGLDLDSENHRHNPVGSLACFLTALVCRRCYYNHVLSVASQMRAQILASSTLAFALAHAFVW